MELVLNLILIVVILSLGFVVGYTFQLEQNLAKLRELRADLDHIIQLSNETDAHAEACIESLKRDNENLRKQLAVYGEEAEHEAN